MKSTPLFTLAMLSWFFGIASAVMYYLLLFQLFAYAALDSQLPSKKLILVFLVAFSLTQIGMRVLKKRVEKISKPS
jgi:hypothetical protein